MREENNFGAEDGEAVVEFIMLTATLLIPLVYVILTLVQLQATMFAVEATARDVAFLYGNHQVEEEFTQRHVEQIFTDYLGEEAPIPKVDTWCVPEGCAPGSLVYVEVSAPVPLPLIPTALTQFLQSQIAVTTQHSTVVEGVVLQP